MRVTLLASILLGLSACYAPDLDKVRYTCSEAHPRCPGTLACVQGCCGGPPCSPAPIPPLPNEDGGVLNPVDWAKPPGSAPGCATGRGYNLGSRVAACPGAFASGQMLSRCAAGWSLCATSPLSVVDAAKVPYYFAGAAHGTQAGRIPDGTMACSWAGAPSTNYLFVFGVGAIGRTLVHDSSTQGRCGLYPSALECVTSGGPQFWQCPLAGSMPSESDATQVANPIDTDGVLCCS